MITPRQTRLLRAPDLQSFRRTLAALVETPSPLLAAQIVVVPSRSAAHQASRTTGAAVSLFKTRDELYDDLASRLPRPPRRLSPIERDSIMQAATARAAAAAPALWFQLRPGLIAEVLRFYDELRRHAQSVSRFEELIDESLASYPDSGDRAVDRMRRQTKFLAAAFREYEDQAGRSGAVDEHALRAQLLDRPGADPLRHVIVTMADWIADPAGLYAADFDLLARLPGLERLDIVSTEATLSSGFHERVRNWLPELDEVDASLVTGPHASARPRLVIDAREPDTLWQTFRDREEELAAVARRVEADRRSGATVVLDRVGIVCKHPLPYLYLAPEVFGGARLPYQAFDNLPLAAEPTAAALDLVLDFVESRFARSAIVALLRSPHFTFETTGQVTRKSIAALDRDLSSGKYLGELDRLEAFAVRPADPEGAAALRAAIAAARKLSPLLDRAPASGQLNLLSAFLNSHFRSLDSADPFAARELRAREAIVNTIANLSAASAQHFDPQWTIEELAAALRRWLQEETFGDSGQANGVHLIDDQAARFGEFDQIAVVGLVDQDWPERPQRNIFFPPAVLRSLGWPSEKDRRAADAARFLDLLASAAERVSLSAPSLDGDSLVARSALLDEVSRAQLSTIPDTSTGATRVFDDELLSTEPVSIERLSGASLEWARLRAQRPDANLPLFHGVIGAQDSRTWSVSALESYLGCPFRFYAQYVLSLKEEPEDQETLDPRGVGVLIHDAFQRFFSKWQDSGEGRITRDNLEAARAMFANVVEESLAKADLTVAEASLERTRLLGSPAATGLGETVLRIEAERAGAVVERLLEQRVDATLEIETAEGTRKVAIKGKIDRVDLLADGTFRLFDYKLGWPPNKARALQLPIYSLCTERQLDGYKGRRWTLGEAAYVAFKGPRRVVPLFTSPQERDRVLGEAQQRLLTVIDGISRGEFPPTPDDVWRCESCTFPSVCRKDYVGDV